MKIWKFIVSLTIVIIGYGIYIMYFYYASPRKYQPYTMLQEKEDTLRIAYIGDSWAFMHQEHNCLIPKILSDSIDRPVAVYNFGICGQTSRELYESIHQNLALKEFLTKRKYDYCFISVGINDTYKKMSTVYYQRSMNNIICFFLTNNVRPIILEIPDYDIYKSFERQFFSRKVLRRLSMLINGTQVDCKQLFRDALDEMLIKNRYLDKVNIIRFKIWNNKNYEDLNNLYLTDGMHLNKKGYEKLDSCIAAEIKRSFRNY